LTAKALLGVVAWCRSIATIAGPSAESVMLSAVAVRGAIAVRRRREAKAACICRRDIVVLMLSPSL
jgi:hypothetical protein